MRRIETFLARRYLLSRRGVRFINVIGGISIGGITIGVAALLVALSVFNGFSGVVTSVLVGFDPHVRIEKQGGLTESERQEIDAVLLRDPDVKAFSPMVSGKAMLVTKSFNKVVYLRGVEEQGVAQVSGLKERMVLGSLAFRDSDATDGIIIGLTLADRLSAIVGNEILVISPSGFQTALSGLGTPQTMKFRVTGIFESNNKDYDASYAYISLSSAQRLFDMEGIVNGVEMRLTDFSLASEVKDRLSHALPAVLVVSTWFDLHRTLYLVMSVERWAAYVLLTLIIVVAMFNMLGSLTMGVIEKRRDIAVLTSMGMTPGGVVRLFMFEGVLIGIVGTVCGMALGGLVLYLQMKYLLFPLDTNVYIIPGIPVDIHWMDFVSIAVASLGLSWLTAYYPAKRAAATLPADALRWE